MCGFSLPLRSTRRGGPLRARRFQQATLTHIAGAVVALVALTGTATGQQVDWSAWEELPVFHNGRVMPLISFAEEMAELICGRANPVLEPDGAPGPGTPLFPDGRPRRFRASELVFSWLVAPDYWESVPFLLAGHEELRTLLGVPVRNASGSRLRFVSPRTVAESASFREQIGQINRKVGQAEAQGIKVRLTPFEDSCQRLYRAFRLYQMLSFRSNRAGEPPAEFWEAAGAATEAFRGARDTVSEIDQLSTKLPQDFSIGPLAKQLTTVQQVIHELMNFGKAEEASVVSAESLISRLGQAADELRRAAFKLREDTLAAVGPKTLTSEEWQSFLSAVNRLATLSAQMTWELRTAHVALFEPQYAVRVVPALEPAFLEVGHTAAEEPHVWLALVTVLDGTPAILGPMPEENLRAVRAAFAKAEAAYRQGAIWTQPKLFSDYLRELSEALRGLGTSVNRVRDGLPVAQRDVVFDQATRYPEPGALSAEIVYHRLQPFLWAWVTSGLALVGFGLSFGVIRRVAFVFGAIALLASAGFIGYGLTLRAQVTGYTPVTNMFETVLFVAMVTAVLGLWIVGWPWFGPALTRGWRLTAVPKTFEETPLSPADLAFARETTWRQVGWISATIRLLLGLATIAILLNLRSGAKGGQPIFSLLPGGGGALTLNDWVVWFVGILVLVSAAWFVPRVLLAIVLTPFMLPFSLRGIAPGELWRELFKRRALAAVSAAVTLLAALVAYMAPISGKRIAPLMPVLRDNFWLALHVLTITASYGAGALVWGLANLSLGHFLLGRYRLVTEQQGGESAPSVRKQPPEACSALAQYMYRGMQVAVVLLAAGTIFGGLWADVSWGRFWGWDSKEVWALIALLVYLGVLHGRLVGMLNEFGLAVGAIFGATAIIVAWYGVNFVFGSGLHSYGEGTGGGGYVALALVLNWLFVGAAWLRYKAELLSPGEIGRQQLSVESA
ncbi:MAG: cytochrome c biogenesis protein [Thermoguttaceae bacterium]|nr:cytochrome c biogenesis protein [Thermoguttaceae bacterium]